MYLCAIIVYDYGKLMVTLILYLILLCILPMIVVFAVVPDWFDCSDLDL